ncbi:MAG: hypothetical protein P1U46_02120 [Patescibacteria group bacterium]|nr:hypothetical protein [Patescibacteria group bacterium]
MILSLFFVFSFIDNKRFFDSIGSKSKFQINSNLIPLSKKSHKKVSIEFISFIIHFTSV